MVNAFSAKRVNLIMANGTPALLAAANMTTEIPVLGTSVTDYEDTFAGEIPANVTGKMCIRDSFSRALASGCGIIILNHPTRGVDVGAREEIYSLIREIVAQGNSVILLGDTLDECIGMATRIIVLRDGLIRAEFDASVENKPSQVDVVSHMM